MPKTILDHHIHQGQEEFLVHWHNRSPADATWEVKTELLLRFSSLGLEDKAKLKGVGVLPLNLFFNQRTSETSHTIHVAAER
jgi:hypothetical protein